MGNSLVVQWLGLGAFTARARVHSLVRELKSCKPCGVARKIKKERKEKKTWYKETLAAALIESNVV